MCFDFFLSVVNLMFAKRGNFGGEKHIDRRLPCRFTLYYLFYSLLSSFTLFYSFFHIKCTMDMYFHFDDRKCLFDKIFIFEKRRPFDVDLVETRRRPERVLAFLCFRSLFSRRFDAVFSFPTFACRRSFVCSFQLWILSQFFFYSCFFFRFPFRKFDRILFTSGLYL